MATLLALTLNANLALADVHLNCGGEGQKPCVVDPCDVGQPKDGCPKSKVTKPHHNTVYKKSEKATIYPCDMGCPKEGCPCPKPPIHTNPPPKP